MARRGKKHEEHVNHERWLITYADLITLLLVFFVIMYAMSKIDVAKFDVIAKSLQFQFKKSDTLLPHGNGFQEKSSPGKGSNGDASKKNESDEEKAFIAKQEKDQREKELKDLQEKVSQYVEQNNLQTQIHVTDTPRGIAITLNDLFLFDLGKADLKPPALPLLDKLATLIPTLNTKVSIEGHTDNLPLATGSLYKNNWGLSSARSQSVIDYFIDKSKLNGNMFIGAYYADTKPVAPNDSEANRQKNRRVEIIVLRDPVDPNAAISAAPATAAAN